MQRREFLGSLFGGAVATPLGAPTEQPDRMHSKRERNEVVELRLALRDAMVENERLRREIGKKNRLVHEMNCLDTVIIVAAELNLQNTRVELSHDIRFDLEGILHNGKQIGRLIREFYELEWRRNLSPPTNRSIG